MTVVVNTHNAQEEKVLLAFLDSLNYDYQNDNQSLLTEEQQQEILLRDEEHLSGKVEARNWKEIVQELERVYR